MSTQFEFVHSIKVKIMYINHSKVIVLQLLTIINFKLAVSDSCKLSLQRISLDLILFVVLGNYDKCGVNNC